MGWHLDGAAAHYLARLPHHIGTFLALTGSTLKAQDVMYVNMHCTILLYDHIDSLMVILVEFALTFDMVWYIGMLA